MRRVIFLDIDGVLAPIHRWDRYGGLDSACIQVLNEIVARGGADVVISSTWRYGKTAAELQLLLESQGFTGCVLDTTPTGTRGADRGEEIAAWLAEHAVSGYVIIDDHVDMSELGTHLVQTHHPAPRGQISRRPWIERDELHELPRLHAVEAHLQLEDKLTTAEIAGVPRLIGGGR